MTAFAGCLGSDEDSDAIQAEPCAPDDIACLCEYDQSCIDEQVDADGDGLFDASEQEIGTDINNPDTDGDGVGDGVEVAAGTNPLIPYYPNDGAFEFMDIELESVAGHMIPISIFKPVAATPDTPFPVLLQSHGFTGERWKEDRADVSDYIARGFAVISFDQRGHGDARDDSKVMFMHPDAEVRDTITILDYISAQDWVLKELDDPTDPVLGTFGYSYGGAFQLMGSVFDSRIDAMVPEMTWHNILEALAPNGAIKSGWVNLFYAAGNAQQSVVFSDEFHAGFAYATSTNELPDGSVPGVPDLVTLFLEASPESYPGKLTVPTQLIQGMPDTLFPLNQAVWNYDELEANGAPVQLATHLGGHVLNAKSLYAEDAPNVGLQGAPGTVTACGSVQELTLQWQEKWLLDLPIDTGPKVCMTLEDGSAIIGDSYPLPSTEVQVIDIGGPFPVAQGSGAGSAVPLTTISAAEDTVIAGVPRLKGSLVTPGPDAIVYFSFYKLTDQGGLEHIVDDQVRPLRIKAVAATDGVPFDIELGGIATKLLAGEDMMLVVTSQEPMYFGNSERLPSGVILQDLVLDLPIVTAPVPAA